MARARLSTVKQQGLLTCMGMELQCCSASFGYCIVVQSEYVAVTQHGICGIAWATSALTF